MIVVCMTHIHVFRSDTLLLPIKQRGSGQAFTLHTDRPVIAFAAASNGQVNGHSGRKTRAPDAPPAVLAQCTNKHLTSMH